jgi:hypothetical protein
MNTLEIQPTKQMVTLKTICIIFDMKYETIYKLWKSGNFVQGYRTPTGRGIRFNLRDVENWIHQNPVEISRP